MAYVRHIVSPDKFLVEEGISRYRFVTEKKKDEPTRTRRAAPARRGCRRPPDSRRRNEQAGTEPRTTLTPVASGLYPPRFAAPVRPGARTATGLTKPGWPRPHPQPPALWSGPGCARSTLSPAAHVPEPRIDRSIHPSLRDGIGVALQPL